MTQLPPVCDSILAAVKDGVHFSVPLSLLQHTTQTFSILSLPYLSPAALPFSQLSWSDSFSVKLLLPSPGGSFVPKMGRLLEKSYHIHLRLDYAAPPDSYSLLAFFKLLDHLLVSGFTLEWCEKCSFEFNCSLSNLEGTFQRQVVFVKVFLERTFNVLTQKLLKHLILFALNSKVMKSFFFLMADVFFFHYFCLLHT